MGAWGALIMSFFGAFFASLTLYWQQHATGVVLLIPFLGFALFAVLAVRLIRMPGTGIDPSPSEERAITWSTVAEAIGLFLASNIVINLHRPDLLLPSLALVVGLHFIPIAFAAGFRPFYVLGGSLVAIAAVTFAAGGQAGGTIAGLMSAGALWIASSLAVRRDRRAKRASQLGL